MNNYIEQMQQRRLLCMVRVSKLSLYYLSNLKYPVNAYLSNISIGKKKIVRIEKVEVAQLRNKRCTL